MLLIGFESYIYFGEVWEIYGDYLIKVRQHCFGNINLGHGAKSFSGKYWWFDPFNVNLVHQKKFYGTTFSFFLAFVLV